MNIWENAVITNRGLALLAKLVEGNTLDITRVVAGAGYVTPGLLQAQEAVSDIKQTLTFREITYPEEGKCCIPCFLTNDELEESYTARQIGIYAADPDEGEILFFINQAVTNEGELIPSKDESPGFNLEWNFNLKYSQADNVTLMVDPSNVVTTVIMEQYVEALLNARIATIPEIDEVTQ